MGLLSMPPNLLSLAHSDEARLAVNVGEKKIDIFDLATGFRLSLTMEDSEVFRSLSWLPLPKILHPYPNLRFDAKYPPQEPHAGMRHVRSVRGTLGNRRSYRDMDKHFKTTSLRAGDSGPSSRMRPGSPVHTARPSSYSRSVDDLLLHAVDP